MADDKAGSSILLFLGLVLAFSAAMWALIMLPSPISGGGGGHYVEALMWCPALAAFATALILGTGIKDFGLQRFGGRYALWGYLIPLAYAALAYGAVWLTGLGGFPSAEGIAKLAARTGWHITDPAAFIPLYFLLIATTGMVGGTARALGEEIGWRGFLLPRLAARFGFTGGAILSGAIWAAWHVPLILGAGYNNGTPAWFAILCFAVMVIGSAVILAWLRLKSDSVWPCALCHASHNAFIQTFFTPLTAPKGVLTAYAIDEFGFALAIAIPLFAFLVWRRR